MKHVITTAVLSILCIGLLFAERQTETFNRGLIAVRAGSGSVFLSWRFLKSDGYNTAFNVYRNGTKLNSAPITNCTNYTDATSVDYTYTVRPVVNGVEQIDSESATTWSGIYKSITLSIPDSGTTPAYTVTNSGTTETYPSGQRYGYNANDCSIGDVDGDGEMEIILKWDPSNSRDNAYGGYTGNVYIDAYKLNGTKLWRIDLGINIRAGAHYTQFMVYDLDGDGKAEVACKTAPGTKDATGNYLSNGPAASDDDAADYRNSGSWPGFITSGPEYLTIFNGQTGAELISTDYIPSRTPSNGWGKSSETTNRVDRFLACIAFLDGQKPSLVMCRGYYGRLTITAWDYRGGSLTQRWAFDSNTSGYSAYAGQGNHNLSVGDVDDDGKDEIVYGSSAYDDNGKPLYTTGLGHGDAMHMGDFVPTRPGLEVWEVHESYPIANGSELHDAKTGAILFGVASTADVGRGMCGDVDPRYPGYEYWSSQSGGTWNSAGTLISTSRPAYNAAVWWDGDLLREMLDGTNIFKWNYTTSKSTTLLSAANYSAASNNSTKANACLSADLFGDWREEVILRTTTNSELRIFSTTTATNTRFYSLLQDPQYRLAIAWQNAAYNQPPHTGFYLGPDLESKMKSTDTVLCYNGSKAISAANIPYDAIFWNNGSQGNSITIDTSVYKINTTNKMVATYQIHGYQTKDSINVKIYKPVVTANVSSPAINASGSGLSSYQWYVNDSVLTGSTNNSYLPVRAGTYKVEVTGTLAGCKSMSLPVIIKSKTENITICQGSSYKGHTESGTYSSFITTDSILITNLTVLKSYNLTNTVNICNGDTYKGHSESGTYVENLTTTTGCDSIVTTVLTVNPAYEVNRTVQICYGDNYMGFTRDTVINETLTSQCSCDSIIHTSVIVKQKIDTSVLVNGATLTANSSDARYQWFDFINNQVVDTTQSYTAVSNEIFGVIISKDGCSDTSSRYAVILETTNVGSSLASEIKIYPNPTSGTVNIDLPKTPKELNIQLYDALGRLILSKEYPNHARINMNFEDLPNGLYLIKIIADKQVKEQRIQKISN
jgi:rhamnogalacturonan endolyase